MMKDFLQGVGVANIIELFTNPGRLYFGWNLIYVRLLDWMKGTNFSGGKTGRLKQSEIGIEKKRGNDYSPTPRCLIRSLRQLYITDKDRIIDMGCGKGLAMYYMSAFPFSKVSGIELSNVLVHEAKQNLKKISKNCRHYQIFCADAGKWCHYEEYSFFYIYNSFPREVVREVIQRINESIERRPRKVVVLYLYPEFPEEIVKEGNFVLVRKGSIREIREGMHIYVNIQYRNALIFNSTTKSKK